MTSLRHNGSPQDGYLDAARACILDVGWRRTTLTEVARRAGVSRMTIYRAWPDMGRLLGDLMTREWAGIVDGDRRPRAPTSPTGVLDTVRALRDNELFVRIVELDPELLLPYLLNRRGRSQDLILDLIEDAIRAGQADGTVRAGNPAVIARSLVLAAHGFVLSGHTMVDDDVSEEDLYAEARARHRPGARAMTPSGQPRIRAGLDDLPDHVDVVVVGLGVTGAGVALDAATRGPDDAGRRRPRPRVRHLALVLQARPRRPALPRARARSASPTRAPSSAAS